jgi:hypothetical protein
MAYNPQQFQAVQNTPQGGNGFTDFLVGTSGQNISSLTPEQQEAQFEQLQQGRQNANFDAQEQAARRSFATNTIPGIAERFTAFGNNQRSSAFQSALGSAGSDLESQLANLRSQYGQQQLQYGGREHLNYVPGSEGFLQQTAGKAVDAGLAYATGGMSGGGGGGGSNLGGGSRKPNPQAASAAVKGNYAGTNIPYRTTPLMTGITGELNPREGFNSMPSFNPGQTNVLNKPRGYY